MSWDSYITSLTGTGNVDKAAIVGFDGEGKPSIWAATPDFKAQIKSEEIMEVMKAIDDKSPVKQVHSTGFHIAGERYVVVNADGRNLFGKKGKDEGIAIVKTNMTLLIGHHTAPVLLPNASSTVENIADHLIKSGY